MGPWLVDVVDRGELDPWLGGSPPVDYEPAVMLVLGDSPRMREFLPNALDAAKRDPRRVVVWIKDETVLTDEDRQDLFLGDERVVAAVLGADHSTAAWVYDDQLGFDDAAFAFDQVSGG